MRKTPLTPPTSVTSRTVTNIQREKWTGARCVRCGGVCILQICTYLNPILTHFPMCVQRLLLFAGTELFTSPVMDKSSLFLILMRACPASFTTAVAVGMAAGALTCTSASMHWKETVAMGLHVSWATRWTGWRPLMQATDLRTNQRMKVGSSLLILTLKRFYASNALLYLICTLCQL